MCPSAQKQRKHAASDKLHPWGTGYLCDIRYAAEALDDASELQCIGQSRQPSKGLPSLCPPAEEDSRPEPASDEHVQAGASAELVDGYQLLITGDAVDALQSSVCASAQVYPCMPELCTLSVSPNVCCMHVADGDWLVL